MDSYSYVNGEFVHEIEIKRSRFIATVCGEVDEEQAIAFVKAVKRKYPDARHNCYAYVADISGNVLRYSDDGEPSGTAGQPILQVLLKSNLKKTAVVVTRYFGGIKLGANGLVGAYTRVVAEALLSTPIEIKREARRLKIDCGYGSYSKLENLLSSPKLRIIDTVFGDKVSISLFAQSDGVDEFVRDTVNATLGTAQIEIGETAFVGFGA